MLLFCFESPLSPTVVPAHRISRAISGVWVFRCFSKLQLGMYRMFMPTHSSLASGELARLCVSPILCRR